MTSTPRCPSDFALEQLVAADAPGAAIVAEHVDACATCRAKVDAKRADNADFMVSAAAAELRQLLAEYAPIPHPVAPPKGRPRQPSERVSARTVLSMARRSMLGVVAVAAAMVLSFALSHRPAPVARNAVSGNDEAAVLRVQREWMEAIRDKDAAALDRILADDYTYTDSRGRVTNKADSLRQARGATGRMTAFQTSDEKAHIYGDTAIVTGLLRVQGVAGGETYDAEVRFTDILARIDGQWRAVGAHASKP